MNKAIMVGRLTKDVEYDGKVAKINIAVDLNKDETLFLPVVVFGKLSEITRKWLHKGDLISAEIIIKNNNYTDKNGVNKYGYQFIANKINFLRLNKKKDDLEDTPW